MAHTAEGGRRSERDSIIDSGVAARVVCAAADFAVVVDREDVVREVLLGDGFEAEPGWTKLVGKRWSDTVTRESQPKVERLLSDPRDGRPVRSRELNQKVEGVGEVPFRFTAILLDDEQHVVALGRDLRPVSMVQQQIVNAQQAMDREYGRIRQANARYRVLFDVASEGVVVADLATLRLLEVNAAAAAMLGEPPQALQGRSALELFEAPSRAAVQTLIAGVEVKGRAAEAIAASLVGNHGREVNVSASVFRQSGAAVLLLRFSSSATAVQSARLRSERMLAVVDAMPDGFVVTGEDRRILFANDAFCRLVERGDESGVIGEPLDRWLGRPGVDVDTMFANLHEHGTIRNFPTQLRGENTTQETFVTAASALDGRVPCIGFAIRPASSRAATEPLTGVVPRSVDQMRELVGRVSLKEIVRESADMIERLCIQAALDVSGNNRASAAQLLGLSRQGLYSKLQRHALAEFGPA